jgi:hypothetical protein
MGHKRTLSLRGGSMSEERERRRPKAEVVSANLAEGPPASFSWLWFFAALQTQRLREQRNAQRQIWGVAH